MNSLLFIAEKLGTYGVRGAYDYLLAKLRDLHRKFFFLRNAHKFPMTPVPGMTIIGMIGGENSYAKTLRDLIYKLKEAGIPFQTFDLSKTVAGVENDIKEILTPRSEFRVLRYNTIVGGFDRKLLGDYAGIEKYRLIFWEFESGLVENEANLLKEPGILAMSSFNVKEFIRAFQDAVPVKQIVYPFRFIECELVPRSEIRSRYGLGDQEFVVFYNFSISSSYYRKNPEAAIRAFSLAFKDVENARLVFKVQGAASYLDKMDRMKTLAGELGVADKLVFVTEYLSTPELYSLTAASDVYISLHRGEGFGLGIVEAMSLGVPAVVTNYGAPIEFCTAENSELVPYVLRDVRPEEVDLPCYRFVRQWADADVQEGAKALRRLYEDSDYRKLLGQNARAAVTEQFSVVNFNRSIINSQIILH